MTNQAHRRARKPVLDKYGRWSVIERSPLNVAGAPAYKCRCDCGTIRTVSIRHLRHGASKSCGCLRVETLRTLHTTHGETSPATPEYTAWAAMINRCHQSTDPKDVANYQARGIVVCDRWRHSFENFLADVGRRPSARHSLDRYPNNDGSYEPENCRWATAKEQRANQRRRISTKTKLASALLALGHIPFEHSKLMTADQIISLYHFDHGILHAIEPIDEPWNLTPRLIKPHREKSKRDTSIVAKVVRIDKKWGPFMTAIAAGKKPPRRQSRFPQGRKLQSRPFQQRRSK